MDDEFLSRYREMPPPEFARRLQNRIHTGGTMNTNQTLRHNLTRWALPLLAAMLIVASVLLLTFPPAQALAQDVLGLFRVKKFATVTFDPARLQQLESKQLDMEKLISDNVKVIKEPGKPAVVASVQAAAARVGYAVAVPSAIPADAPLKVSVQGAGEAQLTANVEKLQSILDTLGISDAQIPAALNGAQVTVRKPASVELQYTIKNSQVSLIQSPSPEVTLPPGVNLAQLGEIGLRVLGLSQQQARDFAQKVDWTSTFLIPIPANAAEVRQVNVNGVDGLMLNGSSAAQNHRSPYANGQGVVLWAKDGMVYGLQGETSSVDLLELANSVK